MALRTKPKGIRRSRGNAFEFIEGTQLIVKSGERSTPTGVSVFLARMSRGAAPKTPGYDGALSQRPRQGVALIA